MTRYRTIVADPPWDVKRSSGYRWREGRPSGQQMELPYSTMTVDEITALPVRDMADEHAHLYLWTTQSKLEAALGIVRSWGFRRSATLVWAKGRAGVPGGTYCSNTEFILFCRRGTLPAKRRVSTQWFTWPRRGGHSTKPAEFFEMVEQVSPGPYLELFARRSRPGWDVWGDEAPDPIEWPEAVAA